MRLADAMMAMDLALAGRGLRDAGSARLSMGSAMNGRAGL
jgi:hypothetical protein